MAMNTVAPGVVPANPSKRAALKNMAAFSDYRGFSPLAGIDSSSAVDRAARFISDAECILSVMSVAFVDSATLLSKNLDSEVDNRNSNIIAGAMDGVSSLLGLAAYLLSDEGE
jgi:hypothetical protein